MIAHTPAGALIRQYGNTPTGRSQARKVLRAEIITKAESEARYAGLTGNCSSRLYAFGPEHEPCGNVNAVACLCECHDSSVKP